MSSVEQGLSIRAKLLRLIAGSHIVSGLRYSLRAGRQGDKVLSIERDQHVVAKGDPIQIAGRNAFPLGRLKLIGVMLAYKFRFEAHGDEPEVLFKIVRQERFELSAADLRYDFIVGKERVATLAPYRGPPRPEFKGRKVRLMEFAVDLPADYPLRAPFLGMAVAFHRVIPDSYV